MMADTLHPWRALFWEPVAGTGERIMAGVVYRYDDTWACARILRNDVLDSLYGKAENAGITFSPVSSATSGAEALLELERA